MKVYILGDKDNEQSFEEAERFLRKKGHIPINPIKIAYALPEEINNSELTVILFEVIKVCGAVYPLDGWEKDLFARLEMGQAERTEKEIYHQDFADQGVRKECDENEVD